VISLLLSLLIAVSPNCIVRTPHGIPVRGVASWYDATRNNAWYTREGNRLYGAVGTFRWGDTPYRIKVCRADDLTKCIVVTVTDYCGRCHQDLKGKWTRKSRNMDLSPQAFSKLRGLHLGVVQVIITDWDDIRP
jgi:hypothetical protein